MFRPSRKLPGFADLKSTLAQTKETEDPLYQVIQEIIERLASFKFEIAALPPSEGGGFPPSLHHETHEPGGVDQIQNAAWTNLENHFTTRQFIDNATPYLVFTETDQPQDHKYFRIVLSDEELYFQSVNDAFNVQFGHTRIARDGTTITPGVRIIGPISSDIHTLDYYEEGTWIPALFGADGAGTIYSMQTGRYTRIGNTVHCHFYIVIQAANWTTGSVRLTGFPFVNNANVAASGTFGYYNMTQAVYELKPYMAEGQSFCYMHAKTTFNGFIDIQLTVSAITPGSVFIGSITYQAA